MMDTLQTSWWSRNVTLPVRSLFWAMTKRDDPLRYVQVIPLDNPAGVTISTETALQISVVWACVNVITNALAVCRWNIRTQEKSRWKFLPDDPLDYILNVRPNEDMTAMSFRECMMFAVLTWGNAYAEIVRDRAGRITALFPLLPHRVVPFRDFNTGKMYFDYYQQDGGRVRLETEDIFHLKGPGITGLMGDNLVARASRSFGITAAQERFAATYFGNNTIIGGYLKYPRTMDDKTYQRVRESWEDRHKGPEKAHKPAVLEGGMEWIPFTNNAHEAQLVEARKFSVEDICRWYGVPPHKVQHLDRSTYNNIEQQALEFIRDACTPWARRWEQECDYKLFSVRSMARSVAIDMAPLTQGDFKTRMEGYAIARQWGIYTINDILEKEGENPIGAEGDVRLAPLNMQNNDRLLAPALTADDIKAGIPTVNEVREARGLPKTANGDMPANQIAPGQAAPTHADVEKAPPPKVAPPASDSTQSGEEGAPKLQGRKIDLLVDAVCTLFFSAFESYGRKMTNRAIDLRRHNIGGKKYEANLAEERERQRPLVLRDCQGAIQLATKIRGQRNMANEIDCNVEVLLAMDEVDNGLAPLAAAELMTRKLLAAPEDA